MSENLIEARKEYEKYVSEGFSQNPPFKGFGVKFLQFANDKPEEFKELFLLNKISLEEFLDIEGHYEDIIKILIKTLHLNEDQSEWFYKNIMQFALGIASLIVNGIMEFSVIEISKLLGTISRAFLISVHTPFDKRTEIIPELNMSMEGSFSTYSNIPFNKIACIGEDDINYSIDITSILYFEADGDLVFAYTKNGIYKVRQRLYQLEQCSKGNNFIKASKSFLVNSTKIESFRTSSNGRIYLKMINGEEIMASRMYSKEILNLLKSPAN